MDINLCCLRDKQHKIKPVEILTSETLGRMVQALGAGISGIFGWIRVSYDWLMVFKATINQS